MSSTVIQVRDMAIGYSGRSLCSGISFDINEGECIMLCGANGSGKTTLLKRLEYGRKDVMMIPTRIPKVHGFTVREFVRLSCYSRSDLGGRLSEEDESAIGKALETLGIIHLEQQDISSLSDGEFQKAAIASAIVRKTAVVLLDEPTAFLDAENRIYVLQILKRLCKEEAHRPAVIFSTHELHEGLKVVDKVFAIGADGRFRTAVREAGNDDLSPLNEAVRSIFHQK